MTVMTPFGEPFQFDTASKANPPVGYKLTDIIGVADESTVHLSKAPGISTYQLYRRWDDQLVLCYEKEAKTTAVEQNPQIQGLIANFEKTLTDAGLAQLDSGTFTASFLAM